MKFDKKVDTAKLPRHIAFIMDGNGRWATKRLLPRKAGHREGVLILKKVVRACFNRGIPYVSVYAFSTENKLRPEDEVQALFELIKKYLHEMVSELIGDGYKIVFMGDVSYFPEDIRNIIQELIMKGKDNTKGTLNIGLNYGSRAEILRAVNLAVGKGQEVDDQSFSKLLYTAELPDPDLVVRTGGEKRLSNFLTYQCAYAELFFTDTLWPNFNEIELDGILDAYSKRDRRFGKI